MYIHKTISGHLLYSHAEGRISAVVISPPSPHIGDPSIVCDNFFLPSIIVWSPYITYPSLFPPNTILFPSCGLPTSHSYWNDGTHSSNQPRLIHDLDNVVYLVSAVYNYVNRHRLLAHDESILGRFPTPTLIPFVLLKQTGMTSSLSNMCTSLAVRGMNFQNMETFVLDRRLTKYSSLIDITRNHALLATGSSNSEIDFWSTWICQSPSDYTLKQCFLTMFVRNEQLYLRELTDYTP